MTDVRYRMSLPVIRALGKSGVPVIAAERDSCSTKAALGFYSRYAGRNALISDAEESTARFIDDLRALSDSLDARPVIMPVGMTTLLALAEHADEVSEFADTALAPISSIELANDKARLIPFAESVGIPVPETTFISESETVEALSERIKYPCVIKLTAGELLGLDPANRYAIIHDKKEFMERYPVFASHGEPVLIQQYISGDGYGVSAVFDKNSEPIEIFCHRRIREYPASGGPSCFCESANLPELSNLAVKLLKALSWVGVAMVEFKGNPEQGFYLMEINPRFWGSLALAPNSGCNIPHALYRAAQGEVAELYTRFVPNYKVGHKMRFLLQDMLSFPSYLSRADRKLSFSLSFLGDLLNPSVSDGVLTFSDARASLQYLKQALKKTSKIVR